MLKSSRPRTARAAAAVAGVLLMTSVAACGGEDTEPVAAATTDSATTTPVDAEPTTSEATSEATSEPTSEATSEATESEATTNDSGDQASGELAPCTPDDVEIEHEDVVANASGRSMTVFLYADGEPCAVSQTPIVELFDVKGSVYPTGVVSVPSPGTATTTLETSVNTEISWSTVPSGPGADETDCLEAEGFYISFVEGGPTVTVDEPLTACGPDDEISATEWTLNAG